MSTFKLIFMSNDPPQYIDAFIGAFKNYFSKLLPSLPIPEIQIVSGYDTFEIHFHWELEWLDYPKANEAITLACMFREGYEAAMNDWSEQ